MAKKASEHSPEQKPKQKRKQKPEQKPEYPVLTRDELLRVGEVLVALGRWRDAIVDPTGIPPVALLVDVKVVMVGTVCVTEPIHPILRRGRAACFYNATQHKVRLDFSGPGAVELASPSLALAPGGQGLLQFKSTKMGTSPVDLRRTIYCQCPDSQDWRKCSGTGNGPEMEIDDPPQP